MRGQPQAPDSIELDLIPRPMRPTWMRVAGNIDGFGHGKTSIICG